MRRAPGVLERGCGTADRRKARSHFVESGGSMRYGKLAVTLGTILLAACSGYSTGVGYGSGGGGGGGMGQGGGGPVGSGAVGPRVQFGSAHDGSQNPPLPSIAGGATPTRPWGGSLAPNAAAARATALAAT